MEQSSEINELGAALAKAQGEMPGAQMNSTNPFLKSRYADLGAVIEASRPAMAKNGLSIIQTAAGRDGLVVVDTLLLHASGQWVKSSVSLPMGEERGKSAAQTMGSIITYLRRYSYAAMVGVYSDADTDGEAQRFPKQANNAPVKHTEQPVKYVTDTPEELEKKRRVLVEHIAHEDDKEKRDLMVDQLKDLESQVPPPFMTLEQAMVFTNSQGVEYGTLDTEKLANMANALRKAIATSTGDELATRQRKLQAAELIMASRQDGAK